MREPLRPPACLRCGAQWSVVDTEVGDFDFEEVTRGDETCDEG